MELELINGLSSAIDNVYANSSEDGSRKTKAQLINNQMCITYVTILNVAKENDLQTQMSLIKKETNDMINSRLRTIKSTFKDNSGRVLITKKVGNKDNIETLTVSPYSPFRKLKYSCTYIYEVK